MKLKAFLMALAVCGAFTAANVASIPAAYAEDELYVDEETYDYEEDGEALVDEETYDYEEDGEALVDEDGNEYEEDGNEYEVVEE